jgi:hypothetical protein
MPLERRSPLPAGLYWIDVLGDSNRAAFNDWRAAASAIVKVRANESFPSPAPGRDWFKFEVLAPVIWDAKRFGFPNIIRPGEPINSSADTVQRPDPVKDPLDQLSDELGSAGGAASRMITIVALLGGAIVLTNLWSRTRGR